MDIEFVCEHCGGVLKVQEFLAGQSIECYHCHGGVLVPMPGQKAVIEFSCLGCGTPFRVPASRAGSRTKCPKCDAMLVVPDASSRVAPPPETSLRPAAPSAAAQPSGYENLPPPVSPLLRQHGGYRSQRPGPRAGQPGAAPDEEGVFAPPANKVSVGMIVFWVGLGAVFFIAFVAFMLKKDEAGAGGGPVYAALYADVKPQGFTNSFQITNTSREAWHDARAVVLTTRGEFTAMLGEMAPNQMQMLGPQQFGGGGGSMTTSDVPQSITITATLANGRPGRYQAGIRRGPTPMTPRPSSPAPTTPAEKPAPNPDEEGGTISE